jgi:hypothetical protein
MTPNRITFARLVIAFAAVALFRCFNHSIAADLIAVVLTITAIALDGVDGYIARTGVWPASRESQWDSGLGCRPEIDGAPAPTSEYFFLPAQRAERTKVRYAEDYEVLIFTADVAERKSPVFEPHSTARPVVSRRSNLILEGRSRDVVPGAKSRVETSAGQVTVAD